ncbi:putative protein NRT1/ PTR FAMILY 2.14 isoform C [Glycine soja]|uniref:Peptide/nitrate transporter n=1 Tax=Glycine soja TaxID=3848 RepID=A0A445L899_GLYSO|nr:putative protein NRT1/ PTR FAMILY 2.14 isoform C [Glycine soja]
MEGNHWMGMAILDSTGSLAEFACEVEITECERLPDGHFYIKKDLRILWTIDNLYKFILRVSCNGVCFSFYFVTVGLVLKVVGDFVSSVPGIKMGTMLQRLNGYKIYSHQKEQVKERLITNEISTDCSYIQFSFLRIMNPYCCLATPNMQGMVILTLTIWMPQLHPPSCTSPQQCIPPTSTQLGILILGLYWLVVGTGGIGPCTILFAINQFDTTSPAGRKGVNNFFNWYYTSQTMVQLISLTAIVYLQNKNWISGFGTLSVLMIC